MLETNKSRFFTQLKHFMVESATMRTFPFLLFLHISSSNYLWTNYTNYACDIISSAYDIAYAISITQCYDLCINDTNCKGITYYKYLKVDVNNDPTRCYLLNKICNLIDDNLTPVITSFWYNNINQQTECINYPNDWTDEFSDNCLRYESLHVCDNSYNNPSKIFIIDSTHSKYNFNAFETCCNCSGSLYQYHTINENSNILLIEPLWKSYSNNIFQYMICQSYTNSNTHIPSDITQSISKWNFNQFISICQHFRNKLYHKYDIIQSISNTINNNISLLSNFNCIDNNILTAVNNTYYLCDEFDHNLYPFLIQLSHNNTNIYLNSHFINSIHFIQNFQASDNIIFQSQCNILPLTQLNSINIFAILICDYYKAPTRHPTMNPTYSPLTGTEPTRHPLINPTISPSFNPTKSPIIPIKAPSFSPLVGVPTFAPIPYTSYLCTLWPQGGECPDIDDNTDLKMKCECGNELNDGYHYQYDEDYLTDYPCYFGCRCCRALIQKPSIDTTVYPSIYPTMIIEIKEDEGNESSDNGSPWTILIVLISLGVVILCCVWCCWYICRS
eukprot:228923_1